MFGRRILLETHVQPDRATELQLLVGFASADSDSEHPQQELLGILQDSPANATFAGNEVASLLQRAQQILDRKLLHIGYEGDNTSWEARWICRNGAVISLHGGTAFGQMSLHIEGSPLQVKQIAENVDGQSGIAKGPRDYSFASLAWMGGLPRRHHRRGRPRLHEVKCCAKEHPPPSR